MNKSILGLITILASANAFAADARPYTAGKFALELDGLSAGWVRSVEGGGASAEIAETTIGSSFHQHVALPKYDDFSLKVALGASSSFQEWIKGFVNGQAPRKDGAIIAADFNNRARQRAEFHDALISEVTFPACDGSSKDPGYLTVKFNPYISIYKKGGGETVKETVNTKQKQWIPSNFRLNIDGLECKRVTKIDAFTIKQSLEDAGDLRDYAKEPGKLEYPNLKLLIHQSDIDSWLKWYEDFLVKANNGDAQEKNGTLVLLSANLQDAMATINLGGIGLKRFTPFLATQNDTMSYFEVELYVETMTIEFSK